MRTTKITAVTLAALVALSGCSQSASALRGSKPGDTQVVAQWLLPSDVAASGPAGGVKAVASLERYFKAEDVIERGGGGVYFEDGNDVGSGTFNVYLFTDQVDKTAAALIALEHEAKIPAGLRIGVAQYTDAQRKNWTYKPYYPAGLTHFDIMYLPGAPPAKQSR